MRQVLLLLAFLLPFAALAVQPDEMLPDPAAEARARAISQLLRCPVCQGETIDESNAPISRDLRLYVRERIVAGDSDDQVIDAVVDRFGEFVLFQPTAQGTNLVLWMAGPVMAVLALLLAWRFLRIRAAARPETTVALDQEESDRLEQIMRD
ncbi:cytochrome c-type biogenesis protein CcmH [Paracoccus sediminis]|uniref:Cytochrome c-type biogenesis protein n=1 Tax=Paracoccus sediminis TaxID=1214787 RepID=A0A238UTV7_9RHOB|nr:cytochrome c-type biogenesis protein [Paracoccus sediminis]TBN52812.1 cytochrome c-type biogenesis protein CcmH [Paracoccus sediminis]SNR25615.1 cytochrome c-type biogenesis protein CcmH [Paracoccus sediminis]